MTENANNSAKREVVEIRRTPKFLPFLLTGGLLGFLVGLILWASSGSNPQLFGYLIAYGAGVGAALGLTAATVLESLTRARAKRVEATKLEG
ncbi:MAG: hypothetical protein KGL41_03465 [Actinomycetales bacterium]|nr:hypothetical protein [Actinomycetales bacterium]